MTSTASKYDDLPCDKWNLDPVYKSYARLYISDIVAMQPYSTGPGGDAEGELAASLFKRMEDSTEESLTSYELGDLIHVRGRLKFFRGNIEVSASYFRRIQDPTYQTEMKRMEEIPVLYRSVYDLPFVLEGGPRQGTSGDTQSGIKREAQLVGEVRVKLLKLLQDKTIQNFYLHELETVAELLEIATSPCHEYQQEADRPHQQGRQIKSVFKIVTEKLEQDGKVFMSSTEHGLFQAVPGNLRLNESILEILREDCQHPKYEGGCHYMHVTDRLRNHPGYEHIGPDAVKEALTWLESNSEVISTTSKHYMAII
ncbi:CST complex subunit STN1 isoform X2 [Strongylocentrotus purpuratus]|uniref:CST complex subunit STN1 n=1 Tax=Strongylocentrotus purpuratus TaxID=7668 RepID=A0A7M7HM48_STRPU|nr:CST complex subunit STN1 isoform X2 [Strongylocentrotus purpuratus]|eukprot:XP_011680190.1 PREDICTED: CST complex subunit STN1 isoform X2 [Strongylocentrotus purpuratus]